MTIVVFRKFKDGEVIALFPHELGTNDTWSCQSYMRLGQHDSACTRHITEVTSLATSNDYDSLLKELKAIGYDDIEVRRRMPSNHLQYRNDLLRAKREASRDVTVKCVLETYDGPKEAVATYNIGDMDSTHGKVQANDESYAIRAYVGLIKSRIERAGDSVPVFYAC